MTKIALVDMDGVLADWMGGLTKILHQLCEEQNLVFPLPEEQKSWKLLTGDPDADDLIKMGQEHPELYISLPVIDGAKEGLASLEELGYDVFICSTPSSHNPTCASQKMQWMRDNFGEKWVDKTILTADKTLVRGNILVDDKPVIKGAVTPTWEHIVFDATYNQDTKGRRLKSWYDIEDLLTQKNARWNRDDRGSWTVTAMS